jgi:hypothetical protein
MKIFNITPLIHLLYQTAVQRTFNNPKQIIKDKKLNAAVKKLVDDEVQENLESAAIVVKNLYNNCQEAIDDEQQIIEEATAAIELAKERISSLTQARTYGEQTNNFLPLTCLVEENICIISTGNNVPEIKPEDFSIPANFKFKE